MEPRFPSWLYLAATWAPSWLILSPSKPSLRLLWRHLRPKRPPKWLPKPLLGLLLAILTSILALRGSPAASQKPLDLHFLRFSSIFHLKVLLFLSKRPGERRPGLFQLPAQPVPRDLPYFHWQCVCLEKIHHSDFVS